MQEDGTVILPQIKPLKVEKMTLAEVHEALRKAYTVDNQILKPGSERILVTLYEPRKYHIAVIREDSPGPGFGSTFEVAKKGTGYNLDLPVGENDVLNALARSGGLPGDDAKNEVIIYKKAKDLTKKEDATVVIHIPLRAKPDGPLLFKPEDVVLDNGDIVYIEARDKEVFYTYGRLLGEGVYPLPRDNDLDIVQALVYATYQWRLHGSGWAQFAPGSPNRGIAQPCDRTAQDSFGPAIADSHRPEPRHQRPARPDHRSAGRHPGPPGNSRHGPLSCSAASSGPTSRRRNQHQQSQDGAALGRWQTTLRNPCQRQQAASIQGFRRKGRDAERS